jgi:hypothetical protein
VSAALSPVVCPRFIAFALQTTLWIIPLKGAETRSRLDRSRACTALFLHIVHESVIVCDRSIERYRIVAHVNNMYTRIPEGGRGQVANLILSLAREYNPS